MSSRRFPPALGQHLWKSKQNLETLTYQWVSSILIPTSIQGSGRTMAYDSDLGLIPSCTGHGLGDLEQVAYSLALVFLEKWDIRVCQGYHKN